MGKEAAVAATHDVSELEKMVNWASRMTEERAPLLAEQREKRAAAVAAGKQRPTAEELLARASGANPASSGVGQEWMRMDQRYVSEALDARAQALGLEFEHIGVTLGTVIHGADLTELTPALIDFVHATLNERKVIFFRDQAITPAQQVAFGESFGTLDGFPFGNHIDGHKSVLQIRSGPSAVPQINTWHTDVTWMTKPSNYSMMHMVEVPPAGGDTMFADSHAAYLGLSNETRAMIDGATAVHDYRGFRAQQVALGVSEETLGELEMDVPFGVTHPIVRTHPETGKQALYLHGGFMRHESFVGPDGVPYEKEASQKLVRCGFQRPFGAILY
jgi:taurine dioxygenase|eukprot:COSAG06_NODE_3122_length_5818_cov_5.887917_7_plen_332_part_00